jgi:hypothetical protein
MSRPLKMIRNWKGKSKKKLLPPVPIFGHRIFKERMTLAKATKSWQIMPPGTFGTMESNQGGKIVSLEDSHKVLSFPTSDLGKYLDIPVRDRSLAEFRS